ncbi:MAG TPA: IPT/TIG domain-containing protein [Bryobacteraceae bacterium]|nr:IPT/TIG domain-containing protein [Bryobacteraceae bacterium]
MRTLIALVLSTGLAAIAQPVINGMSNAVSLQQTYAPGSLAVIFGKNLMGSLGTNTTVMVGSNAAYVSATGSNSNQLAIQIPTNAPVGEPLNVVVTVAGQASNPFAITLAPYAPAMYTANQMGTGVGQFFDTTAKANPITTANPAKPGNTYTIYATGLGPTNPPVLTGTMPPQPVPLTPLPALTIGTESATVDYAALAAGYVGLYQINFTLPSDASGCATNVVLTVGSGVSAISSPPVTLPIAITSPVVCAVENSATASVRDAVHPAAPNSFISVYAVGLNVPDSAGSLFPATSYQGLEVDFNGVALPLYNVLPSVNLINTTLPSNAPTSGSGAITIKNLTGASQNYFIALAPADVGVFPFGGPGAPNQGVVLLANTYWFAMPASLAPTYKLPTPCGGLSVATPCGQPVHPNDEIVVYFTGGGLATPNGNPNGSPLPAGSVAPVDGSVIYDTVTTPSIVIGGISATPLFSGIAPGTAAEYQINVNVPAGVQPGNQVPLMITFGSSTTTVTFAVSSS